MKQAFSIARLIITTTLCCFLSTQHAIAETAPLNLPPIVITAPKSVQPLWSNTGNYSAISAEQINNTQHTHINEVLSQTPGVWISKGSGQEHLTAIRSSSMSGPGACGAFLYLQDNVPIRPAGFCNINNLFEVNSEQAGSIEVIRGPSSSIFGGNALNGLINITTQKPAEKDQTQVSLEGGPYDFYRFKLSNSLREKDSAIRLDFNTVSSNGYRDETGYGQQKLNLRMDSTGQTWNNSTVLSASLLNQETGAYVEGAEAYKDPDLKRSNPSPDAYRDAWSSRIYSQFSKNSGGNNLVVTPYWRRSQMDFLMHFLPGTPTEKNEQNSAGIQTNLEWNTSKHTFSGGFRIEAAEINLTQDQSAAEVFGKLPQGKQYDFDVNTRHLAGYIGADWQINERLHLLNSLRLEYLHYSYDNNMISGNTREDGTLCVSSQGCRYTRPADRNDEFNDAAMRLGLSYDINERQQIFSSIGSGFRPPQATDLYRLQAGQESADIDSEQLNSFEAGINSHGKKYSSQLTTFVQKKENVIYRNSDRIVFSDGATQSEGVELAFNYEINIEHQLNFAGTYARHRYDNTWGDEVIAGDDMDTAPRRIAQLRWLFHPNKLLNGKSSWTLEANHTSRYYTDAANQHSYPGHTIINGYASYDISSSMKIATRITNIANKSYAERADFSFGEERYFPGTPRALFLTFEWLL
ncbi:MAG: TonB-dependent receptor [Pseudomonadales bacterium]|nr:TonB-dependent receptor [Pseudomonadales bacterium]